MTMLLLLESVLTRLHVEVINPLPSLALYLSLFELTLFVISLHWACWNLHVGPKIKGGDTFDPHCVFPNNVALKRTQVQFLKKVVAKKKPRIPMYVCTMQLANTEKPSAKMVNTSTLNKFLYPHHELVSSASYWLIQLICSTSQGSSAMATSRRTFTYQQKFRSIAIRRNVARSESSREKGGKKVLKSQPTGWRWWRRPRC